MRLSAWPKRHGAEIAGRRDVLRTLAIALITGLGFISVASAQSGNPIRIGMSLALTGAGASPNKVINTALEIWHDDFNALLLTGLPCPGMMMVFSVAAAKLASDAAIMPSMLPPVE